MRYAHRDRRFMEDFNAQKSANRDAAMQRQMEVEAPHLDVARYGHDVTARGQTLGHEIGMANVGIQQQDLDLDKAAWDFSQNRYDRFGQHVDQMGLATSALATRGAMQDFGMEPSEDFWSPYEGMFEEQEAPMPTRGAASRRRRGAGTGDVASATQGLGLHTYKLPQPSVMGSQPQPGAGGVSREQFDQLLDEAPGPYQALFGTLYDMLRP